MAYKIITAATTEPISLEEARKHLRIEPFGNPLAHPDDDYVETLISVAREWCEQYTGVALAPQTIELAIDDFPENEIELPLAPTTSITSVKYVDTSGAEQTVSAIKYALDDYSKPNWLLLTANSAWPETSGSANNVKVRMNVGSVSANVPKPIYAAMMLIIGNLYENRQQDYASTSKVTLNSLPMGVYNLLQSYRLTLGV